VANLSAGPPALHLVFFATWCPPCLDEFRALSELEARWSSRGYRLVLVAVPTRQSRERLSTFLSETRPPGEVLFDVKGAAVKAFAVDRLPSHLLLDARGEVALRSERLSDGVPGAVERLVEDRSRPKGGTR
jgi:thiol-disulfide isomerase/thioredoxin